jgi:hypothetical protein
MRNRSSPGSDCRRGIPGRAWLGAADVNAAVDVGVYCRACAEPAARAIAETATQVIPIRSVIRIPVPLSQ